MDTTSSVPSSSCNFSALQITNSKEEEWMKRFPKKDDIFVRVSGIVNPGQFWVRELPMTRHKQIEPRGVQAEIKQFEERLSKLYNVAPKIKPEHEVENLKVDMLVAVRPSYRAQHWYRARVVDVVLSSNKETFATVFLIDYGIVLDKLQSKTCIRDLPRMMGWNKPLAMMVFLAGMRPLTRYIDYEQGMQNMGHEMASKWSTFSHDFVTNLWNQSKHKLGLLKNWRVDLKGRAHGELVLLGFKKDLNLNKILQSHGHGAFFANLLRNDLEAKTVTVIGPRFTSICGPGSAPGTQTLDPTVDFTTLDEEELSQYYHEADNIPNSALDLIDNRPPNEFDFLPFVSEEKLDKCLRRNQKRSDHFRTHSTSKFTSFGSSASASAPSELQKPMTKVQWILARKRFGDRAPPPSQSDEASLWEECRNIPDFVDSDEDDEDRAARIKRQSLRENYQERSLAIPAGIDIGKFIEEVLERMPEPDIGPKQILPQLLRSPKDHVLI